ncbi:putative F-box protein At1g67623 [Bidens hawaiensis]|uniref:putative F-box protein At1g67623 n=1 Tax=Bidens hawaiensis TaxID=980011 RepID=UPI004049ACF7
MESSTFIIILLLALATGSAASQLPTSAPTMSLTTAPTVSPTATPMASLPTADTPAGGPGALPPSIASTPTGSPATSPNATGFTRVVSVGSVFGAVVAARLLMVQLTCFPNPKKTRKMIDHTSFSVRKHEQVSQIINQSTSNVRELPRDLLVDVLARVASSSFTDLFNAKISCKEFLDSTSDDCIAQSISIDKFPIIHWFPPSKSAISFLTHCFKKGNPESLFRQGMIDYFSLVNVNCGLEFLKKASEKGHSEATYVYGMILLSSGDQSSQEGLNLLNCMNNSKSTHWNVQDCRNKIDSILSQMWINNRVTLDKVNTQCHKQDHAIRFKRRSWSLDEDKEIASCKKCLWYRELVYFCKAMNVV